MKIRTDFVTNSSSYCNAEILVDNPVLLEILQRYKEMGMFLDCEPVFDIGERTDGEQFKGMTKTPAFFNSEFDGASRTHPESMENVLDIVLDCIDQQHDGFYPEEIYQEMLNEIEERREEINAGFLRIYWWGELSNYGSEELETGAVCEWDFQFDPINGEKYKTKLYDREKHAPEENWSDLGRTI